MQKYYKAMKRMILSSVALVFLIPFILTIGIGYYYFANSLKASTISSIKRIVHDHGLMIESFLFERRADLEYAIASNRFEDVRQPEELRRIFYLLQRESSAFVDLGVFNEAGVHVAYHGP
ncbi:MAG: two-component sensor histidine kinase, partial [Proteobacteria bacterium]|nr:two-component sensor histidine kinase [Pseudomonadota bacterium]